MLSEIFYQHVHMVYYVHKQATCTTNLESSLIVFEISSIEIIRVEPVSGWLLLQAELN